MNFIYKLRAYIHSSPKIRRIIFWVCVFFVHVLVARFGLSWRESFEISGILVPIYVCHSMLNKKYTALVGYLYPVCVGIALLYTVFDDFLKAIIVTIGIFLIRLGLAGIMEEFGNPDAKLMKKIANYFSDEQEKNSEKKEEK